MSVPQSSTTQQWEPKLENGVEREKGVEHLFSDSLHGDTNGANWNVFDNRPLD